MTEKYCSTCRRFFPPEQIMKKSLPRGGTRPICVPCYHRARTRSDEIPALARQPRSPETCDV